MAGKKTTKKKDVNAPKKPKTGYFLFCDDHREEVKKELGGKSASEVSKVLGERWNNLTDEEKAPYNAKYKIAMEKHKKEMEEYKKNKPESEEEESGSDSDSGKKKRKRGAKKAKKDVNAPKRPLTSYMIYSNEKRKQLMEANPSLKVTDVAKQIGALWKELSEAAKKPYVEAAEKLKKAYAIEKAKYDESNEAPAKSPKKKKTKKEESEEESSEEASSEDDSE